METVHQDIGVKNVRRLFWNTSKEGRNPRMATVIMALLYVLEGAILTVTAVVTGIKHSEFPDVRVGNGK